MSISSIKLVSGRELEQGLPIECTSTLRWIAVCTHNFHTEKEVYEWGLQYAQPLLPRPYLDFHPIHESHSCRRVRIQQDESAPRKFTITADYSTAPLKEDQHQANPLNKTPSINWTSRKFTEVIRFDKNGKAILNAAGDPILLEAPRRNRVVHVSCNVADVPAWILDVGDVVNSTEFTIQGRPFPPYTAMLDVENVEGPLLENDVTYFVFRYSIEHNVKKWSPIEVLNEGLRETHFGGQKQIMDNSTPKRPITTPVCLDADGLKITDPTPESAVFLPFEIYDEMDFHILPGVDPA